jgi:uncharacterized membrane-anchored protein YjiN (DUF445 family)
LGIASTPFARLPSKGGLVSKEHSVSHLDAPERAPDHAVPPPLAGEADRRRRLTVMRRWATGTLIAVSSVWFVLLLAHPTGEWAHYARAALEASMVGALADWFAVTALFRHPLGIPIPHTAIVVERKEQFGQTLATFFRENFLSGATVAARIRSSAAVSRAATWLADPEHAATFVRNVLERSGSALDANADQVIAAIVGEVRHVTTVMPLTGVSATILRAAAESSQLDDGIDAACTAAQRAIVEHGDELEVMFAGERPWWLPDAVQHRLFEHLLDRTVSALDAIARDPGHPARARLRTSLAGLADRLEHDEALGARLRELQGAVARDPRVDDMVTSLVAGAVDRLRVEAGSPGSRLEGRLVDAVTEGATRVRDDPELQARIERSIEGVVDRAMARFGNDVDALVTGTIAHWDAARTADQLELLLGPDLQYIRINGAVVGGLAGLVLHAVAQTIG